MHAAIDATASQFELNKDQLVILKMASSFVAERVAPHTLE